MWQPWIWLPGPADCPERTAVGLGPGSCASMRWGLILHCLCPWEVFPPALENPQGFPYGLSRPMEQLPLLLT